MPRYNTDAVLQDISSSENTNKGDNAIRVTLDDPSGTADGASILMIGNVKPSLFTTGGVVLVHGASVLDDVDMAMAALPLGYPFF